MPYASIIQQQIENDGFVVSVQRHGKIHTVAATRGGITHIVQADCLATAFIEMQRSIREALTEPHR